MLPCSNSAESPVFTRVTAPVPQGDPVFDYAHVVSYSLTVINRSDRIPRLSWVTAYLDNLIAMPGSQYVAPVTRGAVYTIYGVQGTARAPVSMSFTQPPSAGTPTTITAAGPGLYTVPAGTTYLKVENTGGGGAGAGMTVAGVGAGGRGGEYAAEPVFPVSAGQVIPYVVGAGDTAGVSPPGGQATVFGPAPGGTLQVFANGGASVATNSNTEPAALGTSANAVEYQGGAGRANPAGTYGGGGGSSAGPSSAGQTPMGSGSVTFTTTGTTMWTCPPGVTQVQATPTGAGGGGGCGSASGNGQGGGGGECRTALIPVTPGNSYPVVVGTGGAGGTGSGNGSAGGQSSFTGDSQRGGDRARRRRRRSATRAAPRRTAARAARAGPGTAAGGAVTPTRTRAAAARRPARTRPVTRAAAPAVPSRRPAAATAAPAPVPGTEQVRRGQRRAAAAAEPGTAPTRAGRVPAGR